jgi:hypothetical protein
MRRRRSTGRRAAASSDGVAVADALIAAGAGVDKLWHAATLGLTARLDTFFAGPAHPPPNEVDDAFW